MATMTSVEPLDFTKQSVSRLPSPEPTDGTGNGNGGDNDRYPKISVAQRADTPSALSKLLGKSSTPGSDNVSPSDTTADIESPATSSGSSSGASEPPRTGLHKARFTFSGSSSDLQHGSTAEIKPESSGISKSSDGASVLGPRSRSSSLVLTPPGPGNGFVFGAGEVGNISSPRYSVSVQNRERLHPGSLESRFIVNIPRTPSSQQMATGGSSSFLGRSFSRMSISSRNNNSGSLGRTSSMLSIRRFVDKPWKNSSSPPDSPAGSLDSRSSSIAGSPAPSIASSMLSNGFAMRGSTTGFADELGRKGSLSKSYGKLGKTLGEGAGGHVKIIKSSKDGRVYAVKEFRAKHSSESQRDYQKKVGGEYCLGMTLKHPNIVETLDIVYEPDHVFQVMEYCEFDLFAIVMSGKMSTAEVYCDFRQLMDGIKYLHNSGIAHRDLKLDNCVVSADGIVKIIDFGSSVIFRYPESDKIYDSHGVVGSDPYLAPEAATGDRYDPRATDIWSAGVVICCMLMRKFPWKAPRLSDPSFKTFIATEDGVHVGMDKLLANLPEETWPLLRGMFDLDPAARWSVEQCWEDPWLSGTPFCTKIDGVTVSQHDHTHSTVPFEEAHIAMLEKKNKKAKKGEKLW